MRYSLVTLALAIVCPAEAVAPPTPCPPAVCLDATHWDAGMMVPPEGVLRYIDRLGRNKDLRTLLFLAQGNFPCSDLAAGEYVRRADTSTALAYCATLEIGSAEMGGALIGLGEHPRAKVIGYFKQLSSSSNREIRYQLYSICGSNEWNGLEAAAKRDLSDQTSPGLTNLPISIGGETMAKAARRYLDRVR